MGKVNQVQTVKSGWMLPVRTDMPQKLTLPLGFNIGSRTIAYNCKSAKITAGSLPQGVSLRVMGDGTLCLQGTPTKKGYSVATIQIVTTKNHTVTKPVGIMVADEANVTVLPLKDVTYQSGDTVNIPLEFTSDHVNTFVLRKYAGFLPYTMTYEAESAFGRWRILSSLVPGNPKLRYTASPGQYEITLDMITYPSGDVYRRPVRITVKHKETKNVEMSIHATQYEELTYPPFGLLSRTPLRRLSLITGNGIILSSTFRSGSATYSRCRSCRRKYAFPEAMRLWAGIWAPWAISSSSRKTLSSSLCGKRTHTG